MKNSNSTLTERVADRTFTGIVPAHPVYVSITAQMVNKRPWPLYRHRVQVCRGLKVSLTAIPIRVEFIGTSRFLSKI